MSWLGIISSLFSYAKLNVRILSVLISLEGLMLSLLLLFFSSLSLSGQSKHFLLILLTFAACEAALGLSLLVSVLRLRSNDYVSSLSSLNFYV
nr:NADH dehydrogenase subunit 4L [Facelina auriculata]